MLTSTRLLLATDKFHCICAYTILVNVKGYRVKGRTIDVNTSRFFNLLRSGTTKLISFLHVQNVLQDCSHHRHQNGTDARNIFAQNSGRFDIHESGVLQKLVARVQSIKLPVVDGCKSGVVEEGSTWSTWFTEVASLSGLDDSDAGELSFDWLVFSVVVSFCF